MHAGYDQHSKCRSNHDQEFDKGCHGFSHPVPSATLPCNPKSPKNCSVGTLGDCGASAGEGRPVVDLCSHHILHDRKGLWEPLARARN
eukprot:2860171-Karenia_brevis.AAC.1